MASNDTANSSKVSPSINKKLDLLDQKMDGLYKDIYISRPDNRQNLDRIIDTLDNTIDKLQGSNTSAAGMTELLRRVDKSQSSNTQQMINSVQDLFENQNLVGSMIMNDTMHNYIAAQDYNYDLICTYLPKLEDALEIKRDNVLCSDNFSKSFINPKINRSSKEDMETFNNNVNRLEDEYDISEFFDETYMRTSKYGEDFIYVVPYPVAFERLFKRYNFGTAGVAQYQSTLFEGYEHKQCLKAGYESTKDFINYADEIKDILNEDVNGLRDMPKLGDITLHFNTSNIINSSINERYIVATQEAAEAFKSLSEAYFENTSIVSEAGGNKNAEQMTSLFSNISNNRRKSLPKQYQTDGLIVDANLDRDASKLDKDFLGAVLERIPRENIVPIYIGKKCVGYYYFEFAEDPTACGFCGGHHATLAGNGSRTQYEISEYQQELAIRYISARISQSIDVKFINANKDLKEEIYNILNYNEKFDLSRSANIGITFIPADDMVHTYFKLNEKTHRGISDLQRAVMPAMLYILLYLTDIIGKITRSTDKRVYYVKQNVETNVAKTMMNVVQQIKKGSYLALPSI